MILSNDNNKKGSFEPHPVGQFAAVCADVYETEQPNPYKGSKFPNSDEIDNRETITKVVVAFLTESAIELPEKGLQPRYVSVWNTATWSDQGNFRKFITGWLPEVGASDKIDTESLVGMPAYLTIAANISKKNGKTYHNVVNVITPPPGYAVPSIPADFKRRKDKLQEPAEVGAAAKDMERPNDLPF